MACPPVVVVLPLVVEAFPLAVGASVVGPDDVPRVDKVFKSYCRQLYTYKDFKEEIPS